MGASRYELKCELWCVLRSTGTSCFLLAGEKIVNQNLEFAPGLGGAEGPTGANAVLGRSQVLFSAVMLRLSFCKKYYQNLNIRDNMCFLTMKPDFIGLGEKLILDMGRCACFLANL